MTSAATAMVAGPRADTRPSPGPGRRAVYLHPGQIEVSAEPTRATTILGSCVAVCLWDPKLRLGGVNHYLLPDWVGNGVSSGRFGNVAIERLIEKVLGLGSRKQDLRAKVFGGACVLEAFRGKSEHLGTKNVEVARTLLRQHGIRVVAEDVEGQRGRKLIFHTDTGAALVKPVQES